MSQTCTAFAGSRRIASGTPSVVALAAKAAAQRTRETILVFDDATGRVIDFDLRGSRDDVLARFTRDEPDERNTPPTRGPGRPKLGVVAREVTLLPRHWDWLNDQPGGASVALRKLVEAARKDSVESDKVRRAQTAADRFMSALAGNRPGYEDAARALYAGNREGFNAAVEAWPQDVRDHARRLAEAALTRSGVVN